MVSIVLPDYKIFIRGTVFTERGPNNQESTFSVALGAILHKDEHRDTRVRGIR